MTDDTGASVALPSPSFPRKRESAAPVRPRHSSRPRVHLEHVSHGEDEPGVLFRRNAPHLRLPWLQFVFFPHPLDHVAAPSTMRISSSARSLFSPYRLNSS